MTSPPSRKQGATPSCQTGRRHDNRLVEERDETRQVRSACERSCSTRTGTARAATVPTARKLDIANVEVPEPAPDGVVVEIRYCGVCGTDVHAFETPQMLPPAVFGHGGPAP